jgi:site-specific DNA-cytosine methylase
LNGDCWTASGSESPSAEKESLLLLSGILQPPSQLPNKYFLTPKTAVGIIRRASNKGKSLPTQFQVALEEVAAQTKQEPSTVNPETLVDMKVFHNHGFSLWKQDINTVGTLVARDVKGARHYVVSKYAGEIKTVSKFTEIDYERLMGWDDDHTRFRADGKETPSTQRYKMCGNGVVSPVATWIAQRITKALDKSC